MNRVIASTIAAAAIIGVSIFVSQSIGNAPPGSVANVAMVNGKQFIDISAKGGYSPRVTSAKANVPTVLKIDTNGTFDCSAAVTIPSLDYRATLPPSGTTEIEVPPQKPGTKLQGLCAMGMYNFSVTFN